MYQEWIDGWQLTAGVDFLSGWKDSIATPTEFVVGGVPLQTMLAAKYNKVFKFNISDTVVYTGSSWEDASTNNAQRPGEAWVYQADGNGCVPGATPGADKNGAGTVGACFAAKVKKRWINLDTSGVTYLNAVKDNYDSKLSTFNTAAASYNTYLADLKTANEKDAFSAFFSPPKKPAMVQRPGAPTMPATYTGLQHWPVAS